MVRLLTIIKILLIKKKKKLNSSYESNLSPTEVKQFFDHLGEVGTIGSDKELYDDPITIAEIKEAILKLKMNKSLASPLNFLKSF